MAHEHSLYDTDMHFLINTIEKTIKNQSKKTIVVRGDHNSERFTFEIPRYVEGHDMSLCNLVQIHFINVTFADVYKVKDLQTYPDDDSLVVFSWKLERNTTQKDGGLHFAIHFKCVTEDGTVEYEFRTRPFKEITVAETIDNVEAIVEEYPDILAEWEARLQILEGGEGGIGSGVYIGTGKMPNGYNVQIDPTGEAVVIPTKVSELENDLNFITADDLPEGGGSGGSANIDLTDYAKKDEIPTKTSELENDSDFVTSEVAERMLTNTDKSLSEAQKPADAKAVGDALEKIKVNDIPHKTSQLENDSGYITLHDLPECNYVLTDEDKTEIAEQAASLIDTQLLSILGDGVIE